MELQTRQDDEPEINLTSLIDVVFLLLIFFMVSATFERQALLQVELPEAATSETQQIPEVTELIITADGDFYLNDRELADTERDTIRLALTEAFEENPEATLVIRADGGAPHRLVVRAMDAAAAEGIERLSIATVEERESGESGQ